MNTDDKNLLRMFSMINASAFVDMDHFQGKAPKRHRLVKRALASLDAGQLQQLVSLLEGRAALVKEYTVEKVVDGWQVQSVEPGSDAHICSKFQCSCADFKFRIHECKHIQMLKDLL